jgi:hypothetical protein
MSSDQTLPLSLVVDTRSEAAGGSQTLRLWRVKPELGKPQDPEHSIPANHNHAFIQLECHQSIRASPSEIGVNFLIFSSIVITITP